MAVQGRASFCRASAQQNKGSTASVLGCNLWCDFQKQSSERKTSNETGALRAWEVGRRSCGRAAAGSCRCARAAPAFRYGEQSLALKRRPVVTFHLPWHAENSCWERRRRRPGSGRDSPGRPSAPRSSSCSSRGPTGDMAQTAPPSQNCCLAPFINTDSGCFFPLLSDKNANFQRPAAVKVRAAGRWSKRDTCFCVKQQARTHLVGGVKVHRITPRRTCCPTSQLRAPQQLPPSDQTTDCVGTVADWRHLVAHELQRNHAGERACWGSGTVCCWWIASVLSLERVSVTWIIVRARHLKSLT